jgi:hypothetical protein
MTRGAGAAAGMLVALLLAGCGSSATAGSASESTSTGLVAPGNTAIPKSLLAGERPIGRGPRFEPSLLGTPSGSCTAELGRRAQVHIELFGADRVVLLRAGIGTRRPRRFLDGRLTQAGCFGAIVTLDPTGTVYFRRGQPLTLEALFREWGHALTPAQMASFAGTVRVYIDGRRRPVSPDSVRLAAGAEIVVEVGPYVPPHASFPFPKPPPVTLR